MENVVTKRFWSGKKVLITGHTGFKGSWMCILLNMLEANIYGYSLKPKKNSLFSKLFNLTPCVTMFLLKFIGKILVLEFPL